MYIVQAMHTYILIITKIVCFTITIRMHNKTVYQTHPSSWMGPDIAVVCPVQVHMTWLHLFVCEDKHVCVCERECCYMHLHLPLHCKAFDTCHVKATSTQHLCNGSITVVLVKWLSWVLWTGQNKMKYTMDDVWRHPTFDTCRHVCLVQDSSLSTNCPEYHELYELNGSTLGVDIGA
jgi:hypothetical protein